VTPAAFNAFCAALPAATYVNKWDGAHVWKVGGKVFAIGAFDWGAHSGITFKVSDMAFELLPQQPGLRPAPYMASRGLKWVQNYAKPGLKDRDLKLYLKDSHRIVAAGLSRKKRAELGLG
jgi:predicted DNA-binding protein (MmcQ/YjbR family)